MTDTATLKKRVIVDIKAIVVGYAKDGVNELQLNEEYKEQNGRNVPFIQLGYTSLKDFLKSIPDVVRLVRRGLETRIFPIADEKNAHIVSLVCKTVSKRGGKSRRGGRSSFSSYGPRFTANRPRLRVNSSYNYSSNYDYNRDRHITNAINQLAKNPGSVPNMAREKIENSLSMAGVDGVDIDYFQTNFNRFSGYNLNFQAFGFSSLVDCLKSIPNIVTLRGNGTGKTYCISTAALEKAKNLKANSQKPQQEKENFLPQKPQQQTTLPARAPSTQNNRNQVADSEGARSSNYYTVQTPDTEEESLNETLKRKIRKVLEEHKNGLCLDNFLEAFEKLHNEPLNLEEIGYYNIKELVDQFDDIFGVSQTDNPIGKAIVYDVRKPPPPIVKNPIKPLPIPKDLIKIIEKLIQIHPDGISFSKLTQLYKLNCKTELPYVLLGYNSIESFVEKLMSHISFHLCEEKGTKIIKLNQQDNEKSKDKDSGLVSPEPSSFFTIKCPRLRGSKIPPDAATKEDQFSQQKLDENLDSEDYFEIVCSDITNPSHFWFQIIGIHTTDALDILMNKLVASYREPSDQDYMVPHNYFLMNMPCVAKYIGDWHRAEMIGFPSNEHVELLYVDYGTRAKVTREEVRLIKKEYISFPKQAIKARLALLEPASNADIWSTKATARFLDMVTEKKLLCRVVNKDDRGPNYKKGLSIQLCEPRDGGENLCINDVLIEEGLAKISQEETLQLRSFYNGNSEQIEKPYDLSHSTAPGLKPQYISSDMNLTEPKTVFKPPPGLKHNPILQKLALKALNKQKYDSLDSQSPSPPSAPSSLQFDNPTESRIPFRGLPTSLLQTATVAPNHIHSTPKRDGITVSNLNLLSNTNVTPEKVSMRVKSESPASYLPTSESPNYPTKLATTTSALHSQARYTKMVKFTKMYDGHVINYVSRLYLATGDISYYIYRTDILVRLFKKLKLDKDIEMKTIEEEQCPSLFQELRKCGVRGFSESDAENSSVTLLPLESCIKALQKIPPVRKELEESIQKVLDDFDPEDQYWKEPLEDEPSYTEEMINEKLKQLEIARRAITKQMSEQDFDLQSHLTYTQIVEDYIYYLHLPSNKKVQSTNELIEDLKKALDELSTMKKDINSENSVVSAQKSVQPVAPITINQTATTASITNAYTLNHNIPPQIMFPNMMTPASMLFPNGQYMQHLMHPTFQRTPMFGANNAPYGNIYYNTTLNQNP